MCGISPQGADNFLWLSPILHFNRIWGIVADLMFSLFFRSLLLEKELNEWHSCVCEQVLPYLVHCRVTEMVEEFSRILKNSIRVDANVEVWDYFGIFK